MARAVLWLKTLIEVAGNAAGIHWELLRQDFKYALRGWVRTPGFAVTAVLIVGLGVGANTGAFSVTDLVLIRPLPFADPDRLVRLWENHSGYTEMELSPANYRDWKRMSKSFEAIGAYTPDFVNLVGQGEPVRLQEADVSAELFPLLGVRPFLGRLFTTEDGVAGAPGTVVFSYGLWQTQFGGNPGVLGQRVKLDDEEYTVIAVMPPDFHFPRRAVQLWRTLRMDESWFADRNNNILETVARLKPGVSLEQARTEMNVVSEELRRQYPKENEHTDSTVYFLRDDVSRVSRPLLLALCGAAVCILLIACANLMNLLLARSLARQRELAVRTAMGAGFRRIMRQMVTESLALAALGGALGILVAMATVPLLAKLVPDALPVADMPSLNLRMLMFAGMLAGITGICFGVIPALRACSGVDLRALREGSRAGGGRKERLRSALVVVEVMASVVLLIAAGLLMRALVRIQGIDPGFSAQGVLTLQTALPMPKYEKTVRREEFYTQVLEGVRKLPGVSGAAYISWLPMSWGGGIFPVNVNGQEFQDRSFAHSASMRFVTPEFFSTMAIPLKLGRDVSDSDTIERPFVAVVSESFVRRYWPAENPLGRHFDFATHDREVVGVVGDVRVRGLEQTSEPQVYLPSKQFSDVWFAFYAPKDLAVRSSADPGALLPSIRAIIHRADPEQPVSNVQPLASIVQDQTESRSAQVKMLGALAAVAFVLACVGIHGLLSFLVSQRAREIGVRIALGAQSRDIMNLILRRSFSLALAGILPGLALAYAAGRTMQALLAGIKPDDTPTFLSVMGLCLVMTFVGSFLPTLRAVRVDPITVIRAE